MNFLDPDSPLSSAKIAELEAALKINLPRPLREAYLMANGGVPEPYVFEEKGLDTVVSEFLPLDSESRGSAIQCYKKLILDEKLLPPNFFPFAVDGGGDYFFTDMNSVSGEVFFYKSDSHNAEKLLGLDLSINEFWEALKEE